MTPISIPHEASAQAEVFTCWPCDPELWEDAMVPVRAEFARFIEAMLSGGLRVTIVCANDETEASARQALGGQVAYARAAYGDTWARDTGPVFIREDERLIALRFRFNGWGGKYIYAGDDTVARDIARLAGAEVRDVDLVGEGGAFEFDGDGSVLTTRQCLLNANRNPDLTEAEVEARLLAAFGARKILWVDDGLLFDHTDGHIDNIARFVKPGHVVCQSPSGDDDPQADRLEAIARELAAMTDAHGRKLEVHRIVSPGLVRDAEGEIMPASHLNYVFGPETVVVPVYGTASEHAAIAGLQALFPERRVIGAPARATLFGGGAFHCVTCHVPAGEAS